MTHGRTNSCAHSAYYACFHVAIAALLRVGDGAVDGVPAYWRDISQIGCGLLAAPDVQAALRPVQAAMPLHVRRINEQESLALADVVRSLATRRTASCSWSPMP